MTRAMLYSGLAAAAGGLLLWTSAAHSDDAVVARHMRAHLAHATQARDALLGGDLAAAREPLKWLAEHRAVEGLPEGWWSHVDQFNQRAAPAVGSTDPEVLAKSIAGVAQVCGNCHTQLRTTPQLADREVDPIEGGVPAHMEEHLWAMDRMWAGLIGLDAEAWALGAAVLVSPPVHHDPDIALPEDAAAIAERLHVLGVKAAAASSSEQQTAVYSELLVACSECHVRMGTRPDLKR
ncbi:MAG: mono/diheme cytochrome c family protein [Myxococcota bacterium]|jgi:mono/diheme cytochrome c family protein